MEHRIEIEGLSKTYKSFGNEVHALINVNFTADENECVAVMGVSGSGKSTLLNIIGCMDYASGGKYLYCGENVGRAGNLRRAELRRKTFGIIPQDYDLLLSDSVYENVQLPMALAGVKSREAKTRAKELIDAVGLYDKLRRKARNLSGGEKQRVAAARALANDPDVILADEPTAALDHETAKQLMEMLIGLCKQKGKTLIIVTHDRSVAELADRIVEIKDGVTA